MYLIFYKGSKKIHSYTDDNKMLKKIFDLEYVEITDSSISLEIKKTLEKKNGISYRLDMDYFKYPASIYEINDFLESLVKKHIEIQYTIRKILDLSHISIDDELYDTVSNMDNSIMADALEGILFKNKNALFKIYLKERRVLKSGR